VALVVRVVAEAAHADVDGLGECGGLSPDISVVPKGSEEQAIVGVGNVGQAAGRGVCFGKQACLRNRVEGPALAADKLRDAAERRGKR
jgi:malic enzyme